MESYASGQHAQGLQMNYHNDFTTVPATKIIDYNHLSGPVQSNQGRPQPSQQYQSTGNINKTNLIINYLPQTMTDREFEGLFSTVAPIKNFKICRDRKTNYSYGYGFVEYFTPEAAQQAIGRLNGHAVQNKFLKVALSREGEKVKGANLYITNLPKSVMENNLKEVFGRFGTIIQPKILRDPRTGLSKGAGFVLFDKKPEAESALAELNGKEYPGHPEKITIKFAENNATKVHPPTVQMGFPPFGQRFGSAGPVRPPMNRFANRFNPLNPPNYAPQRMSMGPRQAGNVNAGQSGHTLFVYNIGPQAMEQDLYHLFQPFGLILKIDIIWDNEKNQGKGYCFVTMANRNDAESAQNTLNGYMFANKPLQVSFKKPKKS